MNPRHYQRLDWMMNANTGQQVLLRICPDCGAVVASDTIHNAWHDTAEVSDA